MTGETRRKERIGVVVSKKMQKTVVVAVETFKRHRIYKKILRHTRRFKVHDEKNACGLGDLVRIVETRPLSRESAGASPRCWSAERSPRWHPRRSAPS